MDQSMWHIGKKILKVSWLLVFISIFFTKSIYAQNAAPEKANYTTRILFLLDASGSMLSTWDKKSRMQVAKELLRNLVDSLERKPNLEIALRVYGHMSPKNAKDCNDTRLEVPFKPNNHTEIKRKLLALSPKGNTPIANALLASGADFPAVDGPVRNIVILITDGIESCDGDPCAVSLALQKKHIFLKPFIIGLGLDPAVKDAFDCVGTYFDAQQEENFKKALKTVVAQALQTTTLQINLLNSDQLPKETNIPFTLYDAHLGISRYNFIHTFNNLQRPDTMLIDPINTYNLVVHSWPEARLNQIKLNPGQHNTISLAVPSGFLDVKVPNNAQKGLRFAVYQAKSNQKLLVTDVNSPIRLLTGTYKIEVFTLPKRTFEQVEIENNQTYRLQIPASGNAVITSYAELFGAIFELKADSLVKVYELNSQLKSESIALQPGNYVLVARSKNSQHTIFTVEKLFAIRSGETTIVKVF